MQNTGVFDWKVEKGYQEGVPILEGECLIEDGRLPVVLDVSFFPPELFRYRSAATDYFSTELEKAITGGIFLGIAKEKNDPFELSPNYVESGTWEVFKSLKENYGNGPIASKESISQSLGGSLNPKTRKEFVNTLMPTYNLAATYKRSAAATVKNIPEDNVIACFSEEAENIPMWAHYADDHAGVVLCFSIDVSKVQEGGLVPLPVKYLTERPRVTTIDMVNLKNPSGNTATLRSIFLSKSEQWAYEKEWRILNPDGGTPDYYHIPCLKLEKVILGVGASDTVKDKTAEALGGKIPLFKAHLNSQNFGFDFQPI